MESTLEHIDTGGHILNMTTVTQTLKEIVDKWDVLKLRSFCKAKDTVNKMAAYRMGKDLHKPHQTEV